MLTRSSRLNHFLDSARRIWPVGLAIAVAVAFVVAATMVADAARTRTVEQRMTYPKGTTGVLTSSTGRLPASVGELGVPSSQRTVVVLGPDRKAELDGGRRVFAADERAVRLVEGSLPKSDSEVALDPRTAQILGASPGTDVHVRAADGETVTFRISGIAQPRTGTLGVTAELEGRSRLLGPGLDEVLLRGDESENRAALGRAGDGTELRDVRSAQASQYSKLSARLGEVGLLMTALTLVAGVAGTFVIANTFYVVASGRRREAALQRAVGASQRQVRSRLRREALLLGGVASAGGAALGAAIGSVASNAMGSPGTPGIPLILGGILMGLLITGVGVWAPIRSAARVAPVEALRHAEVTEAEIPSRKRWLLAAPLIAFAALAVQVPLVGAVIGGLLTFLAIIVLGPVVAPAIGGGLLRGSGASTRLARANVTRHPKRSARTSAAVLLGVALASSAAALSSAVGGVHELFPRSEVTVFVPTVTPEMTASLEKVEGVTRVSAFRPSEITLNTRSSMTQEVAEQVARELPRWPGARLASTEERAAELAADVSWITTSLAALAAMALIVGLLGVLNTVRLSTQERRQEFAVLRAIGMTRSQLIRVVVLEAAGMTGIGVVLGLALGAATVYGMLGALSLLLVPLVSWWIVLVICALVVGVAALSAVLPAGSAARVNPSTALAQTAQ